MTRSMTTSVESLEPDPRVHFRAFVVVVEGVRSHAKRERADIGARAVSGSLGSWRWSARVTVQRVAIAGLRHTLEHVAKGRTRRCRFVDADECRGVETQGLTPWRELSVRRKVGAGAPSGAPASPRTHPRMSRGPSGPKPRRGLHRTRCRVLGPFGWDTLTELLVRDAGRARDTGSMSAGNGGRRSPLRVRL